MAAKEESNQPRTPPAMIGAILAGIVAIVAILYVRFAPLPIVPAGAAERSYAIQFWESHEPTAEAADISLAEPPEFDAIETNCIELAPRVQSSVVGVFNPSAAVLPRSGHHRGASSGVVISADGLVLSQFHVSHVVDGPVLDFTKYHKPGEETLVAFADGTLRKANLLGASIDDDLSLVQLSEPGPYPFVEFNADATVDTGDWVVKLGHPGGFRKDRLAPLRLGRVLLSAHNHYVVDCPFSGGDSGGPFFDLNGRLVGVVSFSVHPDLIMHLFGQKAFEASAWTLPMIVVGAPRIAALMERMKRGEIIHEGSQELNAALCAAVRLRPDEWTQSRNITSTFERVTTPLRASVITILNGSVPVALGTVADKDGLAVTKASVLPLRPRCRLPDGRVVDLEIIGVDLAFDLAVVRIPAESTRPVAWPNCDSPPVGRILLPVGPDGRPLSFGIVSVAVRQLVDHKEPKYDLPLRLKADPPPLGGRVENGEFSISWVRGLPRSAGLLPGDHLISIAGHRVAADEDIAKSVADKLSGDIVPVVAVRDGKALSFDLPLVPAVEVGGWNRTWRCDDFPIALEYSPPAGTTECGGPIVDSSGRFIGVTIGQTNPANGWAIPADEVRRIVEDAKKGNIASWTKD